MKREEFLSKIAKAIEEDSLTRELVVLTDTLRFEGDEDGDVAVVFDFLTGTPPRPALYPGYFYFSLTKLMNIVCED